MGHLICHRSEYQYVIRPASSALPELPPWVFNPNMLREKKILTRTASGRATVWFFEYQGHRLILRHYWRGGLAARLTKDRFLWLGLHKTRPWVEMETLQNLQTVGMPVPRPVAARVCRDSHPLLYTADIITVEIPAALPLPDFINSDLTDLNKKRVLFKVGVVLARLHAVGAQHTDLNVRNILIDPAENVSVIDWDKGSVCTQGISSVNRNWKTRHRYLAERSLSRLGRSIRKDPHLKDSHQKIYAQILNGYQSINPLTEFDAK